MASDDVGRLAAGVDPEEVDPQAAPLVFAFRPTMMVTVPEERLAEWEVLFAEKVGFRPPPRGTEQGLRPPYPGETISSCGDWDDCDFGG
jgi:hypothetical protein